MSAGLEIIVAAALVVYIFTTLDRWFERQIRKVDHRQVRRIR